MSSFSTIDDHMLERYSRQMIMEEFSHQGQLKLSKSSVLIIGLGGLGGVASYYLAGAGVGQIGLVDFDQVDLSNLHRQIIHSSEDINRLKTASASEKLTALNPSVNIQTYSENFTSDNAHQLIDTYDIILDASDNFTTRYLINEMCIQLQKPMVSASLVQFEGQISCFAPHLGTPCYACLYPIATTPEHVARCDLVGVFGPTAGILGVMMANEALKIISGIGKPLYSKLLLANTYDMRFEHFTIPVNANCSACKKKSPNP